MAYPITFSPSGLSGEARDGSTVLNAARRLGVDLDSVCGGRQICKRCVVEVDGEPMLACAHNISGPMNIDVPPESQVHRQVVRKDLDITEFELDPRFSLNYIEVGDGTTVAETVAEQHGLVVAEVPRELVGPATVAIDLTSNTITALWDGYVGNAYGIAIDIGSTTVAGHLCDLTTGEVLASAGRMNPQIRFGDDLMSRVSYIMMNPDDEKLLTEAIREALGELADELLVTASTKIAGQTDAFGAPVQAVTADRVLEVVLVANPIMHHIALGYDPTPLGMAPFTLFTDQPVTGPAGDLGMDLPNGSFYFGPCIAGHVGADTAGAILAEGPHRGTATQLLVDVGTNAEIVLGDSTRQFAASSPTGPAFEGAQITHGQRATPGAIERVRIDPATLEPRFKVIGSDLWSDAEGFDPYAITAVGVTGICGSGIIEVIAEMFLAGLVDADGTISGDNAASTSRVVAEDRTFSYVLHEDSGDRIVITQNDIRAIQLAKAALRAGIDLLVEHAGNPPLTDIRLAGAFGAHIDPVHAMILGLVPDCPVDGVRSVGNAAGVGAVRALLSMTARREMETVVEQVVKIETATEPRFQDLFVSAMAFPHASAPTPNLSSVVKLPERKESESSAPTRRRRRSRK